MASSRCFLMSALLFLAPVVVAAFDVRHAAVGRRHAVMGAIASIAMPPLAAQAAHASADELAGIVERARQGKLSTTKVFHRIERDALVDASALGCSDAVSPLLSINKKAMQIEQREVDRIRGVVRSVEDQNELVLHKAVLVHSEKITSRLSSQVNDLTQLQAMCLDDDDVRGM